MDSVNINGSIPTKYTELVRKAIDGGDVGALRTCLDEDIIPPNTLIISSWIQQKHTLLHEAIYSKDIERMKLLLSRGADVNVQNEDGNTPLHNALELLADPQLIEILLIYGADLLKKNNDNVIAFDMFSRVVIYKDFHLPKYKSWIEQVSKMILSFASCTSYIFSGYNIYFQLCEAVFKGNQEKVKKIIDTSNNFKKFEDVDYTQSILFAEQLDQIEMAKLLIECIQDLNRVFLPLIIKDNLILIKSCIEKKCNKNLDINVQDNKGRNAVHYACSKGDSKMLRYFLTNTNISAEVRDRDGMTPIFYVFPDNSDADIDVDILSTLLDLRQIDLNVADNSGCTLNFSLNDCRNLVILLEHGFDLSTYGNYIECGPNDSCAFIKYSKKMFLLDPEFADYLVSDEHLSDASFWDAVKTRNTDVYKEELEQLKRIKIREPMPNTQEFSLYDFIFSKPTDAIHFSENPQVIEMYENNNKDFKKCFENYGFVLNYQYRRALRRKSLIRSAVDVLKLATGSLGISQEIYQIILHNLNDAQLIAIGDIVQWI